MSKYSRTRKAICRISGLNYWIIDREALKKQKYKTWKESYKKRRKVAILFYGYNPPILFHNNKMVKFPCKYKDAIQKFEIWRIV